MNAKPMTNLHSFNQTSTVAPEGVFRVFKIEQFGCLDDSKPVNNLKAQMQVDQNSLVFET